MMHDPCIDCPLQCNPISVLDSNQAKYLVVTPPASEKLERHNRVLALGAMRMFAKHMKLSGFRKQDFAFINSIRGGYDKGRFSSKDRKAIETACREYVVEMIEEMQPEVIIALGAEAAKAVEGRGVKVTKSRGVLKYNDIYDAYTYVMLDPTYVYIHPEHEPLFSSDCRQLRRIIDHDYDVAEAGRSVLGNYEIVYDLQFLIDQEPTELAYDLETLGLDSRAPGAAIMTIQLCAEEGTAYMIPWDHPESEIKDNNRVKKKLIGQLKALLQNPDIEVIGQNCLQGDVEYLSPLGWVRLDAYEGGEVMQWDAETNSMSFVTPSRYITQQHNGKLFSWSGQMLSTGGMTPQHRLPLSRPCDKDGFSFYEAHNITNYNGKYLPLSGLYESDESVELSEPEARLLEAIRADAEVDFDRKYVRFHLSKERKVYRLWGLLRNCGVSYKQTACSATGNARITLNRSDVLYKILNIFDGTKRYRSWVLSLSLDARRALLDEAKYWDGTNQSTESGSYVFCTSCDEEAVWFQVLAHTSGWRFTYTKHSNGTKKDNGTSLYLNQGTVAPVAVAKLQRPPTVVDYSGQVYCFTVPSGSFLIRHNNRVSVTGNCKFDAVWTYNHLGFRYRIDHDTLMLAAEIDENALDKSQDTLTKLYVPELAGYADHFNATYDKSRMDLVPLPKLLEYGAGDTDANLRIFHVLYPLVLEDKKLSAHYKKVAMPGINAFVPIEINGQDVDEGALDEFEVVLEEYVEELGKSLKNRVPRSIKRKHIEKGLSFGRSDYLIDILFNHPDGFRLTPQVYTKTTQRLDHEFRVPSTSSKDHLPYFFTHSEAGQFCMDLAEWMKVNRLLGTNVRKFRENYIRDGKVYPKYSLWTAVTGRSSSYDPNCFPPTVEVLTDRGWQYFGSVESGSLIAQYDKLDGSISFAEPLDEIRQPFDGALVNIKTDFFIDITCTENHRFLVQNRKTGKWKTREAGDFPKDGLLPCAGSLYGSGVVMRDSQIGLICALQADGYAPEAGYIEWVFSKSRKYERLVKFLNSERITYRVSDKGKQIRVYVGVNDVPSWLRLEGKRFDWSILGWSLQSLQTFAKEIWHWDGDYTRHHTWVSVDKQNADIVQAVMTLTGSRATVHERSNTTCQSFYVVNVTEGTDRVLATNRRVRPILHTGEVHCYTMPLGTLVVRQNGKVVITENSQNYPKRGKYAKAYRKIFVPPPGWVMLEADLSQAELRIAADMANDSTMLRIYRENGDIHKATACVVMGVSMGEFLALPKEEQDLARFKAKAVNFGFLYGMWWRNFIVYAKTQYGVEFTEEEAQRIREGFFQLYASLENWHQAMVAFCKRYGFVRSYSGKVRHLPMIWSEDKVVAQEAGRQAINSPVQNFASDLGVMAMARITNDIDPNCMRLTGFVHDALYACVPPQYVEWGAKTLKWYMESTPLKEWFGVNMKLPIVADVGFGWDGGGTYEMKGLDINEKFDFRQLSWDEEKQEHRFRLPRQRRPKNNGRQELPDYLRLFDN